ncbi:hypothetical protein SUGI_1047810 [Cryptomeria japonica]|nr:hypothetical protein SUGI_1047810 [Cryptomeria japonica]
MRGSCFSESAIASAVLNLRSLKYIWVQGYKATPRGERLLDKKPFLISSLLHLLPGTKNPYTEIKTLSLSIQTHR